MDNDFGRVRRALLRQGESDRVPLFELSVDKRLKAAILGRPIATVEDDVGFWQAAGYDFVSVRAGVRSVVRGLHPAVRQWTDARRTGVDAGMPGWVSGEHGIVRTREEFEAFPWPAPEDLGGYSDYAGLEEHLATLKRCLPAGMKLIMQMGYIFMGAWQFLGFENFCMQLADDPEFVAAVVERLATSQLAVQEILLQHEIVGAVWLNDDLCYNSGPVVAPRVYERLIYPRYRAQVERCHAAGIPAGLHSDGDLTKLLPGLVGCGFDGIHPFEPPLNDIVAIKRAWGDRIAVAGGIDLKAVLCGAGPADVDAEVARMAAQLAPGGGWLLGSSNSIPDFVPLENYRALLAAGLRYGVRTHVAGAELA